MMKKEKYKIGDLLVAKGRGIVYATTIMGGSQALVGEKDSPMAICKGSDLSPGVAWAIDADTPGIPAHYGKKLFGWAQNIGTGEEIERVANRREVREFLDKFPGIQINDPGIETGGHPKKGEKWITDKGYAITVDEDGKSSTDYNSDILVRHNTTGEILNIGRISHRNRNTEETSKWTTEGFEGEVPEKDQSDLAKWFRKAGGGF